MSHDSGYIPLPTEDPERHVSGEDHRIRSIPNGGSLDLTPTGSNSGSSPQNSCTYTYRYGPPGLAGLLQNKYMLACASFASIGGLTFGYNQGVIANVLVMKDFVQRWPDFGPWEKGVISV